MRLTTKGHCVATVMLNLTLHAQQGPVLLADISERQGISLSYLEQLLAKLRRGSLMTSVHGSDDGYQLPHHMSDIHMAQMVDVANESVDATHCQGQGDCHSGNTCLTHHLWCDLSLQIHRFLSGVSLTDLVSRRGVQRVALRQDERRCSGKTPRLDRVEAPTIG